MVIVAILVTITIPIVERVKNRVAKAKCAGNLRALHTGMAAYLVDKKSWPRIDNRDMRNKRFSLQWVSILEPYGVGRETWVCPTAQAKNHNPDLYDDEIFRIDYIPTPFGQQEIDPHRWTSHPWFIEKGDVHGNGNQLITAEGRVVELRELMKE